MQAIGVRTRGFLFPGVVALTLGLASVTSGTQGTAGQLPTSAEGLVTRTEAKPVPDPRRHVPDELLVRLKPGLSPEAARRVLDSVPALFQQPFRTIAGLYHVKLAPGTSQGEALRTLGGDEDVLYAEPNFLIEAFATPNDPNFSGQWALRNTGQTGGTPGADIGALNAWDVTAGSRQVVVAVIDSGVDYTHQDLSANVFTNPNDCDDDGVDDDHNGYADDCHGVDTFNDDSDPMDDNQHGTHVAGTIGAVGNDGVGVTGVSWQVTILPCKFLDATGNGSTAGAIACMDYVATMKDRGVNLVATNNSWGGGLFSQALQDAIRAHQQRGILFVAAAGNSGYDNDLLLSYPCAYYLPGVLCVAATTADDGLASFSNFGRGTVHLGAPGVGILSTTPGQTYSTFDGTSMAAPHVTGVVALLHAQVPGRDWREVKNRILAGADTRTALSTTTISHRRLSARGALNCSNSPLVARVQPTKAQVLTGVAPVELAALNINCGVPAGNVVVSVSPGATTVTLLDDGIGRDQVAGDGVYTALWTPPSGGAFTLAYPDGSAVQVNVDAQLEPGFPVQTFQGAGSYHAGPAIHTLVGNIDGDAALEILVTGLAGGPLYAWNSDGSTVPGWPVVDMPGAAYPALGELEAGGEGLEVFEGHFASQAKILARRGTGLVLPGWPKTINYTGSPASLADVDGDGLDEIFTEEEDWRLHGYRAGGAPLPGWPPAETLVGGQERHTPAIADLDGDGTLEIVTASGSTSGGAFSGIYLLAYHRDGSAVSGFPVQVSGGYTDTYPVVGDVDGDGQLEIVVATRVTGSPTWTPGAVVLSASGVLERTLVASGNVPYVTAPALADLDGDGVPEILLQTETAIHAWKGNGAPVPGWPVSLGSSKWLENAAPVVGDLDGDQQPEVVVLALASSNNEGDLMVLRRNGTPLAGFPKHFEGLGSGAVPAIADIDRDGRNELIVTSDYWNGISGYYDKVWVYDLGGITPHGPAEWGQFMSSASHHGRYRPQAVSLASHILVGDVTVTEGNTGTVSADFAVTLSPASSGTVTVNWATADGTAQAGSDYIGGSGSMMFAPGETAKTVSVSVKGDTSPETDETFFLNLSGASGAEVADAQGQATIVNDDGAPPALTCPATPVSASGSYTTTVSGGSSAQDWVAQYTPGAPNNTWIGAFKYVPLPRPATVTMAAPATPGTYELRLFSNNLFILIASCTFQVVASPELSIGDVTVIEGNTGTVNADFTVTLSSPSNGGITVNWATANGTAVAGSDYTQTSGGLTFEANQSTKVVTVVVNGDTTSEQTESFFVNLSGASGATLSDPQGQGTITNDDAPPALTCPASAVPPDGTYATTVSAGGSVKDWVAQYALDTPNNPWIGAWKYVPLPRPATVNMTAPSLPGTYELRLFSNGSYSLLGSCRFEVAPSMALSIDDVTVSEGNSGTVNAAFTVTLSAPASDLVTVNWGTVDGTATTPSDYAAASGSLTFPAGQTIRTVTVAVNGDTSGEADETFFVNLTGAAGAAVSDGQGKATIANDDGAPAALTCPVSPVPPNGSYTTTVNGGTSAKDWIAQYTPGSPSNPWIGAWKYVPLPRPATVTMTAPGAPGAYELRLFANSGYTVIGSCTFQVASSSALSIGDVTLLEGNAGTASANFAVTLVPTSSGTVTVNWGTANGTATEPSDYLLGSGALTFAPGEGTKTIAVAVNGDTSAEADETLFVNLTGAIGASVSDGQGRATITNDDLAQPLTCPSSPVAASASYTTTVNGGVSAKDWLAQYTPGSPNTPWIGTWKYVPLPRPATVTMTAPATGGAYELRLFANGGYTVIGSCTLQVAASPAVSVGDVTVTEGNSGTVNADFTVTLSPVSSVAVSVNWATANGTATAGSDYVEGSGSLTFAPNESTKAVTVVVSGDASSETNETFFVNLTGTSGAIVSDAQGQGTITNDDVVPPALTCPTSPVAANGSYTTTVNAGSSAKDWVAQYNPGAPHNPWIGTWKPVPLPRPAVVTMTAPGTAGTYELRLFANNLYTLIGSCTFQVSP